MFLNRFPKFSVFKILFSKKIISYKGSESFHKALFPIRRRIRNNFLVFCPDMPILDMPILVDPDGIVVKREDFEGHYIIMYHPRKDDDEHVTTGDPKVDWELWHKSIKPKLINRIPG